MFSQVPAISSHTSKQKKKKLEKQIGSWLQIQSFCCTTAFRNWATNPLLKHLMSISVCLQSPSPTANKAQLKMFILKPLLHQSIFNNSISTLTAEYLCQDNFILISVILSYLSDTIELHSFYADNRTFAKPSKISKIQVKILSKNTDRNTGLCI